MTFRSLTLALATSAALISSQASAQACISEAQIESMSIYAVPLIVEGVGAKCERQLAGEGFLARSGTDFSAPYLALQDAAWPDAKAGFLIFASKEPQVEGDTTDADLLRILPDEALRPLFDVIITQKISEGVKPKDCGRIERVLELLAPLPPENTGGLVALLFEIVGAKDPEICEAG